MRQRVFIERQEAAGFLSTGGLSRPKAGRYLEDIYIRLAIPIQTLFLLKFVHKLHR